MDLVAFLYNTVMITIAGLFIAFSPLLIVTNLLIVIRSKRPILHTIVLLSSIVTPLVLLSLIASYFIDATTDVSLSSISDKLSVPPLILLVTGLALVLIAYQRAVRQRLDPDRPVKKTQLKEPPTRMWPLFMFGFTKSILSVTNVFAILFVTKMIVANGMGPLAALIALIWALAVGLIPFFIILYYQKNKKQYLLNLQAKVDRVVSENIQFYITIAIGAVGVILTVESLINLF